MPTPGRPWTDAEVERLRQMALDGKSYSHMAVALSRSETAVKDRIRSERLMNPELWPERERNVSICWDCVHAVPDPSKGTGCSWSVRFKPVEGWIAKHKPQVLYSGPVPRMVSSWLVLKCPKFKEG